MGTQTFDFQFIKNHFPQGIPRLRLVRSLPISIQIKTSQNKIVDLVIFDSDTVWDVKAKLSRQENVNYAEEELCIVGKVLSDEEKTLGYYGIKDKCQLYFLNRSLPTDLHNGIAESVPRRVLD